VIVLSILLAFFVDAWWDGRQERELGQQYLTRLASEVASHADHAASRAVFQARIRDAAMETYELLASGDFGGVDPIDALKRAYDATRTLTPDFTVDVHQEMLATGNLRLVDDQSARERITAYYRTLEGSPEFEFASLQYRDIVRGVLPPRTKLEIRDCRGETPASECSWSITDGEARELLDRLAKTPGVLEGASHVVEQWARGTVRLEVYARSADEMVEYLQGLLRS
jgi:hypothetical protein